MRICVMKYKDNPEKLTIGLVLEDVFCEFAKEVIHGVLACVKRDEHVRLVVLSGRQFSNEDRGSKAYRYRQVFNTIYELGRICRFDGLILALPNMGEQETEQFGRKYFANFDRIPKICIASNSKIETTVNYDNVTGIRDAVDYLINTCNVTRLAMLGGRIDNPDAMNRKDIFASCLAANRLLFTEEMYEPTDMSENSVEEAGRLLDRNPGVQAVFCVNDPVAAALYTALEQRRLVPGRDVYVFGFDNTRLCSSMVPSLASIGPDEGTLGKCAYDALMAKIARKQVSSIVIPTRLFGRESCPYEKYEYSLRELRRADPAVVDRMFDDCFYRYKNEYIDSRSINLKRLFYEIVYRMLMSLKNRYMSNEEFREICELIDVFFDNDALSYTDSRKLLNSIERLQGAVNRLSKAGATSDAKGTLLFTRMKDRIIQAQAGNNTKRNSTITSGRGKMKDFMVETVDFHTNRSETDLDNVLKHFDLLGLSNAALYLYEAPVEFNFEGTNTLPENIELRCILKSGELYIPDADRQKCPVSKIFEKKELPTKLRSYIPFPIFYGSRIYGIVLCELAGEIAERGEYFSQMLSRSILLNDPNVIKAKREIYKAQEVKLREQRQAAFHQLAEGLASHYDVIFYVNSQTGQYRQYVKNEIFGSLSVRDEGEEFFEESRSNAAKYIHPEDLSRLRELIDRDHLVYGLEHHRQIQVDYRMIIDGTPQYTRATAMWGSDKAHVILGIENIDEEVRREMEQIQALNRANELARRDGLTGAKNITAYRELETELQKRIDHKAEDLRFAVVVSDINNLKLVNDSLGHKAGDEYIKASFDLIQNTFPHSTAFRVGGDEFVTILQGAEYEAREELLSDLRAAVLESIRTGEGPIIATGLAVYDPSADDHVGEVFERADKAMYENKNSLKHQ